MKQQFVAIPLSLFSDPRYLDTSLINKMILLTIIRLCAYKTTVFFDHGEKMEIQMGQMCYSIRKLASICGPEFSPCHVQRALAYYTKVGILIQEVIHFKTLITIRDKAIYDTCYNVSDTGSDTRLIQERYTNIPITPNTYKKEKDKKEKTEDEAIAASLASFFLEKILSYKKDFKKPDLDKWTKTFEYMIDVDKRDPYRIRNVICWLPCSPFWRKTCLSADSFRKHFDKLDMNALEEKGSLKVQNLLILKEYKHLEAFKNVVVAGDWIKNKNDRNRELNLNSISPDVFKEKLFHVLGFSEDKVSYYTQDQKLDSNNIQANLAIADKFIQQTILPKFDDTHGVGVDITDRDKQNPLLWFALNPPQRITRRHPIDLRLPEKAFKIELQQTHEAFIVYFNSINSRILNAGN